MEPMNETWTAKEIAGNGAPECDARCASEFREVIQSNLPYWIENGIQQLRIPCLPPCQSYRLERQESSERNLVRAARVTQELIGLELLCGALEPVKIPNARDVRSAPRYGVTVSIPQVTQDKVVEAASLKAKAVLAELSANLERGERKVETHIEPLTVPCTNLARGDLLAFVYGHDADKHHFREPFASRRLQVIPKTDRLYKEIIDQLDAAMMEEQQTNRNIIWKINARSGSVQLKQFPNGINRLQAWWYRTTGWKGSSAILKEKVASKRA